MKRALVTGGSGEIGAAICRALSAQGLHVIVHANTGLERAQALADELSAAGGSAQALAFDLRDAVQVQQGIEALLAQGPIQVLVNNAGVHRDVLMAGMDAQVWDEVIDTNLNGFFRVTQPLLMPMVRTRWGRIINMSSVAGQVGNRGQVNYAAAKAGLIGATKALALELASRHITVNAVAPGLIDTEMIASAPLDDLVKQIPMQRIGTAQEVADAVAFLVGDKSAYMTGQVLVLSGGL